MNLADAIRKAASEGGMAAKVPQPPAPVLIENAISEVEPSAKVDTSESPEFPSTNVLGGNVVRLELFMTHEQTSSLLRAIITGQHNVLTLVEAAHYLRIRPQALAKLSEDGDIPAVEIDGKWRFLKSNLDEWLATTVLGTESLEDQQNVV